MPELPEVETVANGVHERVHGRTILAVWTSGKPQTFKSPEALLVETLTGARIVQVRRVGKTIVMTVESKGPAIVDLEDRSATDTGPGSHRLPAPYGPKRAEFLIHLGMTGRLLVSRAEVPLPPHTHAVLTLDPAVGETTGRELRFVDPRRFGRLSIHTPVSGAPGLASETWDGSPQNSIPATYTGPGREPLTISLEDFMALFRSRKTPIKAALLNQSLLHGVGNIYADESLFRAGIRPRRQAARLTRAELSRLRTALAEVLRHAITLGGSSVSDYVDADGVRGFFQLEHRVYLRTGKPCLVCGTSIRKITVAGRSTHFCPACQR